MSILSILASDNFITVNRAVAKIVGLEAAVIFGELASEHNYWQKNNPEWDGSFFSTVENLEEKTFLSAHQQREAIKRLEDQGWLTMEKRGMPARRYIRLNEEKITESLNNQSLKFLTTSDSNFERPVVKNLNGKKNINKKNIEKEKREEDRQAPSELGSASIAKTTREEMESIIKMTFGAFPNSRKDVKATADAWMLTFAEYPPEIIREAVTLHMYNSKYFPTPAEMAKNIKKARLIIQEKTDAVSQHPDLTETESLRQHPEETDVKAIIEDLWDN